MWTLSGLYFSWTDIDEIHGDQYRKAETSNSGFEGLLSPSESSGIKVHSAELKEIAGEPYYWINHSVLHNARTGEVKKELTEAEALSIAEKKMLAGLEVKEVERITETGDHHEYRGGPLPAYVISYNSPENIKAYISIADGTFRMLRHRDWRWFDFLWMTRTMDYQGRDDINNFVLRAFSLLGLITVLSGFVLWYISSPSVRKLLNSKNKKKKSRF